MTTVRDLIKALSDANPDAEVMIAKTVHGYGGLEQCAMFGPLDLENEEEFLISKDVVEIGYS